MKVSNDSKKKKAQLLNELHLLQQEFAVLKATCAIEISEKAHEYGVNGCGQFNESKILQDAIVDSTSDFIWSVDPQHFGLLSFNQALAVHYNETLGIQIKKGDTPDILMPNDEFKSRWYAIYQNTLKDGSFTTEYTVVAKTRIFELKLRVLKSYDKVLGISGFGKDITGQKMNEARLLKANRIYTVLTNVSQAIVRAKDKQTIYDEACRIAVEDGKFKMAWIGLVDGTKIKVVPVAWAGFAEDYLGMINIDLGDIQTDLGYTGQTIKSGAHHISGDIANSSDMAPWREIASKMGYRSSATFPIYDFGEPIGAFTLYSDEANFFNDHEIRLLDKLAMDISFANVLIDNTLARKQSEKGLQAANERFNQVLYELKDIIWTSSLDGNTFFDISNSIECTLGISMDELKANPGRWLEIVHPDDRDIADASAKELFATGKAQAEYRIIKPDGTIVWLLDRKSILYGKDGAPEQIGGIAKDITERKESEESLRLSEQRYYSVISALSEGIVLYKPDGGIIDCNTSAERILGLSTEQILGKKSDGQSWRTVHEDGSHFPGDAHPAMETLRSGKPFSNVIMGVHKPDGQLVWISINTQPLFNPGENLPYSVVASFTDVSEILTSQQALRSSEEKFRLLTETIEDVFWINSPDMQKMVYVSPAYEKRWQLPVSNLYDSPYEFMSIIHPDDLKAMLEVTENYVANCKAYEIVYRILPADGSLLWIHERGFPIYDESGKERLMAGICMDITKRKLAEESLSRSEVALNYAQEIAQMGSWNMDMATKKVFMSKNLYRIIGYQPFEKEFTLTDIIGLVHPDDRHLFEKAYQKIAQRKKKVNFEFRYSLPDGNVKWVHSVLEPVIEGGSIIGLLGVNIDITEKKLKDLELIKLSVSVEQSPVSVIITDLMGNIEFVNQAFLSITGYRKDEAIGINTRILKSGEVPDETYKNLWETITSGKSWSGELVNKKKNGELFWEDVLITPIQNDKGEIINYLAIKNNITQRKENEKEIHELNASLELKITRRTSELAKANAELLYEVEDRKRTNTALHQSNSRLELAMSAAKMAWWEMDVPTGMVVFHSRKAEMLGRDPEMFHHYSDFMRLVHPEDQKRAMGAMRDHYTGRASAYEVEYRILHLSGDYLWFQDFGIIDKRDQDGSPLKIVGFVSDISKRKRTQEALLAKTVELEIFFNVSVDFLCIIDTSLNFFKVNKSWQELLCFATAELEQKKILEFIHPDDKQLTIFAVSQLQELQPVHGFVNRYKVRDGGYGYLEWHFVRVGNLIYSSARDITESKRASDFENEMLQLSQKLTGISYSEIDSALAMSLGRIGHFLAADRVAIFEFDFGANTLGRTYYWLNEGIPFVDFSPKISTDTMPNWLNMLQRHKNIIVPSIEILPESWTGERNMLTYSKIKSLIAMPLFIEDKLAGFVSLDSVIKEREYNESEINILLVWSHMLASLINHKRSEKLIVQTRQNYETFFNTIDDFLFVVDLNGNFVHINDAIINRLGYSNEDLIGKSSRSVFPPDWQDEAKDTLDEMLAGNTDNCPMVVMDKSGKRMPIETRLKHGYWNGQPIMFGVSKDISQIQFSEQKFSAAFHSNSAMMAISNFENGKHIEVNSAYSEILGYTREEFIGRTNSELGTIVDLNSWSEILDKMNKNIPVKKNEILMRTKKGSIKTGLLSCDTIVIGDAKYILSVIIDITERKKAEEDLRVARKEAEMANLAKSDFLSRMSHELRTPMNSILGFAQLLEMGELKPLQEKRVAQIINNGNHLLDLINEILDISGIEAGRQSFSLEPVQLNTIIGEMIDLLQSVAVKKHLTLKEIDPPANQLFVMADNKRLKQILINLINNALKYNRESGSVSVKTEIGRTDKHGVPWVRISIIDTGEGISPENISKLFQPFERIGAEKTEIEGTGLGLTVVKKLMDAMGGKLGVDSVLGTGSTFWVELPQAESRSNKDNRTIQAQKSHISTTEKQGTVLYIEDNEPNIKLAEDIIGNYRPAIRLVTSNQGTHTLKLAIEHRPDLILLDLNLPDVHGMEILENLLDDSLTKSIPVVIVSADATPQQIDKLIKAGATDYLIKPLDVVALLNVIDECIGDIKGIKKEKNIDAI